jgi:hypothetical protein
MKEKLTHIIFVVDRSGSMGSIAKDMIGGYNQFIEDQKKLEGECVVSFYQFDNVYESVFERVPLKDVVELTAETYVPRAMTALYDAMGRTINSYGEFLSSIPEEERPERVLFVTITDGDNNASIEFDMAKVAELVKTQTEKYQWDFVFLGSNIDAWEGGGSLNIKSSSTLQFANSGGSVKAAFASLNSNTLQYRSVSAKADYSFSAKDLSDQDQYLDDNLKSKNKQQQTTKDTI